jgi:hypothetical protein
VLFMPFAIGKISHPTLAPFQLFSFSWRGADVRLDRSRDNSKIVIWELLPSRRSISIYISALSLCTSFRYSTKNQRCSKGRSGQICWPRDNDAVWWQISISQRMYKLMYEIYAT